LRRSVQERHASQAGGRILFGTDVGYIEQFDTLEEFALMSRRVTIQDMDGVSHTVEVTPPRYIKPWLKSSGDPGGTSG
jgi:hypothetical protein